jgi:pimeloyl-ACP methyl ester carboxylesterase
MRDAQSIPAVVEHRLVVVLLLMAALAGGCQGAPTTVIDRLHPCAVHEGPVDTLCGHLTVFENPAITSGRTIDLKIVVAPALRRDAADPLFVLEGGPGGGAASQASSLMSLFGRFQTDRDIVFVDQRGSGGSRSLDCESEDGEEATLAQLVEYSLDRFHACLKTLDADLRMYTTPLAMDDLDAVRRYLGYDQINLWGASYGARAALVYLARHEASVRSVVLDSPPDPRIPLYFPRDGQRALDRLIADCASDPACSRRFPDLGATVNIALTRASERPVVRLQHPRTGVVIEGPISRDLVAGIVMGVLYSPVLASVLPQLLADAAQGNFQGLVALALQPPSAVSGSFLSVHCSEGVALLTRDEIMREAEGTFLGLTAIDTMFKPCEFWPTGPVEPGFYQPVTSDRPVLALSGAEDPVAPPVHGELIVQTLTNARHIVIPGTGHFTSLSGCVPTLIGEFLKTAAAAALDVSCVSRLRRPPFFLDRTRGLRLQADVDRPENP